MAATNILVVDNGAYTAKVSQSNAEQTRTIPNSIFKAKSERRRAFIGDQLEECKDYSGLFYVLPFSKGYLVNWDVEKQIWDHLFGKEGLQLNFKETTLLITEPQFNLPSIKEAMDEILFEEYNFYALSRSTGPQLSSYKCHQEETEKHLVCLIIDAGYSFTHIVPVFNGKIIKKAVRRINVGGKLLTNHLKEIISYRQLHVLDETHVINQLKEDTCFISNQFYKDMEICRLKGAGNTIVRDYVLPDYSHIKRGYVKPVSEMWDSSSKKENEQILRMNIERFSVPEVLFHPSDIGIQEMGIAEAVINSVEAIPKEMQPHFYSNILLTGGCTLFPGFKERMFNDVRSLAPVDYDVAVYQPTNPVTYAMEGGIMLSKTDTFTKKMCVTKADYEEHGKHLCRERFDS
ncbi:actin-related protein 6 isoform X2 [Exaiptasia diaphana]|uniref:Actin-related protein 6 n=1 Tax=Exaiptasia diaphana TaxID=2652724 RepID=A0A913XTD2_EXADI|nr:actin-related protein 6 isoform X2 [Exaiptasia diaphana]